MAITRRTALHVLGAAGVAPWLGCGDNTAAGHVPTLQGYAWPPTVRDELVLFVATTSTWFVVELYPVAGIAPVATFGPFAGDPRARGAFDIAWDWHRYAIDVTGIECGVYLAVLRASTAKGARLDLAPSLASANGEANCLVIVRRDPAAPILYKLPLFTYHAYNTTGGGCLYDVWDQVEVSLRRPGGGTGHTRTGDGTWSLFPDGLADPFGGPADQQWNTFERWDAKLIRWLAARGTACDFCTDWDLHVDPDLVAPYRLLLNAGHDEYWSSEMRDQVEGFVAGGGNVAWFGGNTAFWRVEVDVAAALVQCDKRYNSAGHWDVQGRPENAMTGMCMWAAGYNSAPRRSLGYTIVEPDAWPFEGVETATFGDAEGLVGYEVDGAPVDANLALTFDRSTPKSFQCLARAVLPPGDPSDDGWYTPATPNPGVAMIGMFAATGTVFNAGTTDWARVLAAGSSEVARITENVIDRLSTRVVTRRALGAWTEPIVPEPNPFPPPIVAVARCADGLVVATAAGVLQHRSNVVDVLPYVGEVAALVARPHGVVAIAPDGTATELAWTSTAPRS